MARQARGASLASARSRIPASPARDLVSEPVNRFFGGSVKIFGPKDSVPHHPLTPWTIRCMAQTFASASIGDIHDRRALPARFVQCEALGMDCDLPRSDIGCSERKRCPNPVIVSRLRRRRVSKSFSTLQILGRVKSMGKTARLREKRSCFSNAPEDN